MPHSSYGLDLVAQLGCWRDYDHLSTAELHALLQGRVRARHLRREQTLAEARLWEHLRDRRLEGFKFRRQHPLGRFVVDFCCPERRLIVEIDGAVHRDQADRDEIRTAALETAGYTVMRWTNEQVEHQLPVILDEIGRALRRSPSPAAAGEGAGG